MSNLIKTLSINCLLVGDGVSTSMTLALDQFPFPSNPPGRIEAVEFAANSLTNVSHSFTAKTCMLNFDAFSGPTAVTFNLSYDPS